MQKSIKSANPFTIELDQGDRWQAYYRLLDLGILCNCSTGKPLKVSINTPTDALQVWSVARQQLDSRQNLAKWLNKCLAHCDLAQTTNIL